MASTTYLLEHVRRGQQLGVDLGRGQESLAHHEDLSGRVTGGVGLGGVHALEQLVEHPQQGVVVAGSEHLKQGGRGGIGSGKGGRSWWKG